MKARIAILAAALTALAGGSPSAQAPAGDIVLRPTNHPRLPADALQLWMLPPSIPSTRSPVVNQFFSAVKLVGEAGYTKALPVLSSFAASEHPLRAYAQYYKGRAELGLDRADAAKRTFQALRAVQPVGFLAEAAAMGEAEADTALGEHEQALAIYEQLAATKTSAPDIVLMRLAKSAQAADETDKALQAFARLYFEYPFSELAVAAEAELDRAPDYDAVVPGNAFKNVALVRAERLFAARRYAPARAAFVKLRPAMQGDERELVELRIAESDYYLKRFRIARESLKPFVTSGARQGEALFYYAATLRELGIRGEYATLIRRVADDFPTQVWAEEALNHLATHYILEDDDLGADATFREMLDRFPAGKYAERAAWKVGWLAYRTGQYTETVRVFDGAASRFPRSDYRPPWLYWAGRAHENLQERARAEARYTLAATDYLNSYYGRLAVKRLNGRAPQRRLTVGAPAQVWATNGIEGATLEPQDVSLPAGLPPNEQVVRILLDVGLYDQAIGELTYAQKVWSDSPAIQATLAWTYQKQGRPLAGEKQFTLYRNAVNTMRRAYPQFLAAGGENLPRDLLRIIFPLDYWDLIKKYSAERDLDPFLVAALMCQESTFVRDIRSSAKAVGLMQLMPATARQYARRVGLKYSARLLTDPEANIRMGTAYLADKIKEFGDLHLALASYNAGERPVRRWVSERPGLPTDEFIDDIPYPETQNYVKRILGTADDYRRLYGNP